MATDLATHYLEEARRQMRGHKRMGEGAMAQLRDDEFFRHARSRNRTRWPFWSSIWRATCARASPTSSPRDGEKPDRFRDREFEVTAATTRAEVMKWWEEGWACVLGAIDALKPEDVMRTVTIRGEPHTVLQAINRQIAHYAAHIGQIVFLAKHLRSSEWKTLTIPRGKSEEFKKVAPKASKP